MTRDQFRERSFLVEASCGHPAFVIQAIARLEAGEERFGDSWRWIGIRKHLAELLEEAADLGSWAALADQAVDHEPGLTSVQRNAIRAGLRAAAELGAESHRQLAAALEAIEAAS